MDKSKIKRNMELESLSIRKGKYMREISTSTKNRDLDPKYTQMEIFMWVNSHKIKNMVKELFIGSASITQNKKISKNIMELGGEAYQMDKANISKTMVIIILGNSKMD